MPPLLHLRRADPRRRGAARGDAGHGPARIRGGVRGCVRRSCADPRRRRAARGAARGGPTRIRIGGVRGACAEPRQRCAARGGRASAVLRGAATTAYGAERRQAGGGVRACSGGVQAGSGSMVATKRGSQMRGCWLPSTSLDPNLRDTLVNGVRLVGTDSVITVRASKLLVRLSLTTEIVKGYISCIGITGADQIVRNLVI
ncbi:hypothetical protein C2845_PM15G25640 [Panicum miliaceum]|uniref:Uncharacterized protein n=1 Tax=Panicum miliaceum TaxID=4540 RepID=A0A3L6Q3I5_PANMI|nr:hypothetical protein C2845_PM15G25640 [Panicum miliaceum]